MADAVDDTKHFPRGGGSPTNSLRSGMTDWPGLMRRTTAARYCELTLAKFERAVLNGELPQPVRIGDAEMGAKKLNVAIDMCDCR